MGLVLNGMVGACSSAPEKSEHVLLVTIDTLRADRLGYVGYDIATPNLDRLASEGAVFTQAITAVPITLPSHASILSGLYPTRHGTRHNGLFRVSDEVETLAETYSTAGFATAAFVGSFVLDRRFGLEQGFDHYDDELPDENPVHGIYYPERRGEEVVARAREWIDTRGEAPFFVWIHLFDPHAPHNAPSPFAEQYGTREYDAEIAYTDHALGPLFETMNAFEDATVIMTADHGEGLGDHGESTHTLFVYDSTMRVPLVIKGPGIPAGVKVEEQVRSVDIAPTLLELSSLAPRGGIDGVSLLGRVSGESPGPLSAYGETFGTRYQFNWSELRFLRKDGFKVIDAPKPELYDLRADPKEQKNLWSDDPGNEGRRLLRELKALTAGDVPGSIVEMDEETRKRLESLGYVTAPAAKDAEVARPDPKDRVEIFETLQYLLDPELSPDSQIAGYLELLEIEPTNTLARSRLANLLAQEGRLEEAVEAYQELLRISEIEPSGWENMASALLLLDRTEEALAITERAVAEAPWYRELQVLRGEALEKAGRLDEALLAYEKAIELRPEVPDNHWRHGSVALELGDEETAERDFRESLTQDPSFEEGRTALVRLLSRSGRAAEALAVAEEGEADSEMARVALSEAYLASGRFDEARAILEEVTRTNPDNSQALALLGPVYGRSGELEKASSALERVMALGVGAPDVRRNLALVYTRQGKTHAAIAQLRAASVDAPENAAIWFALGNAYLSAKQGTASVEALEKALETRPGWPEAMFNLGLAYELTGARKKAAEAYRSFLSGAGARNAEKRAEAERRLTRLDPAR